MTLTLAEDHHESLTVAIKFSQCRTCAFVKRSTYSNEDIQEYIHTYLKKREIIWLSIPSSDGLLIPCVNVCTNT